MKVNTFKYNTNGKKILIISGIHGNQHTSIYACQLLVQNLTKNKIKIPLNIQQIKIINFVNQIGIYNFLRQNQNGIDLNRQFTKQKSQYRIIELLKNEIKNYDVVIDVHSSFNTTEFFYLNKDKWCKSFIQYMNQINVRYVINGIRTQTIKTYTNQMPNKIGFTLQLNQQDTNIDINSAYRGLQFIYKIITTVNRIKKYSSIFSDIIQSKDISADINGLLILKCNLGKYYKRGQSLGYIQNLNNSTYLNIIMPEDGSIIAFPKKMAYIKIQQPILKYQTF